MLGRPVSPPRAAYRNRRRGFNLIEAAIVLGVVGLVVGGIWWIANKVREDWQVQRVASDINLAASEIRKLFRGLPLPSGMNFNLAVTPDAIETSNNVWRIPVPWKYGTNNMYTIVIQLQGSEIYFFTPYIHKSTCLKLIQETIKNDSVASQIAKIGFCPVSPLGTGCSPSWSLFTISTAKTAYDLGISHCIDGASPMLLFSFKP